VQMIQFGSGAGLMHKPAPAIVITHAIGRQNLDRDLTVQPWIAGAVHLAHPAGAERAQNLVRSEASARSEGHMPATGRRTGLL
jgi:hypothetical protein